jgi:periplasmic copper chaperone A
MRILSCLLLSCAAALFAGLAIAQGADSSIRAENAWARQAPMMPPAGQMGGQMAGGTGAVYVTLRNTGAAPDALVGASSEAAEHVELHETIRDGQVMRMRPVTKVALPAGGVLEMKPGGYHIMLLNLKHALRPGDHVPFTLTFAHAAPLSLDVPIR